jgi:hypothetical protein
MAKLCANAVIAIALKLIADRRWVSFEPALTTLAKDWANRNRKARAFLHLASIPICNPAESVRTESQIVFHTA